MLDKITAAIQDLGIEVEQVHNEGAPGQFEVVTAHQPAMQARVGPGIRAVSFRFRVGSLSSARCSSSRYARRVPQLPHAMGFRAFTPPPGPRPYGL